MANVLAQPWFELAEDTAGTIWIEPDIEGPLSSATVSLYKPDGTALVSDTAATVESVATTVAVRTSDSVFTITSATGVAAGRRYQLTSATGGSAHVLVSNLSTTTVTLADPPPFTVAAADTFKGLRVSIEVTAAYAATRGMHYRAEWDLTLADTSTVRIVTPFHVVRNPFASPMDAERVKSYVSTVWGSETWTWQEYEQIADEASKRVRKQIMATKRYANLFGDHTAFEDAGLCALKFYLVDKGLYPAGVDDPAVYQKEMDLRMAAEVDLAVRSLNWYDEDDDGIVDTNELRLGSIRLRL